MKGRWYGRLSVLVLSAACAACSPWELKDPNSVYYSEVSIAVGDGTNGGTPGQDIIEINDISTAFWNLNLVDRSLYRTVYLKAGTYGVGGTCHRDWPDPDNGETKQLPYGFGTDDSSETFEITVEPHKKYILDCKPGLEKSEFFLREVPAN